MRSQEKQRFCLFKLSDLGMWKSFPRFLVKNGIEVILQLDTDSALINTDVEVGGIATAAANPGNIKTTLKGLKALSNASEENGAYI